MRAGVLLGRPAPRADPGAHRVDPPAGRPSRRLLLGEVTGLLQLPRLMRAAPWLAGASSGDGTTVIDLPGWKAPEASNTVMRTWLRWLGYDAHGWGLGTNDGEPVRDAELLAERLAAQEAAQPVVLLGWSLGGVVAREVARTVPDRVAKVITYGSPVVGGPSHTIAASSYGVAECLRIEELAARLDAATPLTVPVTAIYTRRDGIVDWRACIDHTSPDVRHVEVRSPHLALGFDPDVWMTVADVLAEGRGDAERRAGARARSHA